MVANREMGSLQIRSKVAIAVARAYFPERTGPDLYSSGRLLAQHVAAARSCQPAL